MKNAISWIIISATGLLLFIGGIVVGHFFFQVRLEIPMVEMMYVTNTAIKYVAIDKDNYTNTDCKELADMYMSLRSNYNRYVEAKPETLSNGNGCSYVRIADSVYKICIHETITHWAFDINVGYMANSGAMLFGGVALEFLRAGIVVTAGRPDIGGYVGYSHKF